MSPVIFSLGNFSLRWYGVLAALGFLSALFLMQINRKHARLSSDQVTNIVMTGMLSGVIGARIFYVVQNWSYYKLHPEAIIRIDQGGLVFYGGFILALFLLIFYIRKFCRTDVVRVLDIMAPALPAAHALGRIGCFFNGCCYGKPAQIFCAVSYPPGSEPFKHYGPMPLHPVQLYEAVLNIILSLLLWWILRKYGKRGVTMAAYIFAYGILRFLDEFFRGDHSDFVQGFTPAQVIGFGMIPLGLILLIKFLRAPADDLSEEESVQ